MKQILAITRKELNSYFGSPMALIFLGAFLAVTLFAFFWVETFFARGIADVRPLFQWMPLLLIFLIAALTMRQWSEEQRSGTQEMLLTLPVRLAQLVIGKFLAVMTMVLVALVLTLPLPITVASLGNLDWGPVLGGYLAALLLAAAYSAIGLFVSSRTDNQIVALILTVLLAGLFFLIGTGGVIDFIGAGVADLFRAIGTSSRFESIERGVIDLRDLVYYLSLTGIFLILNVYSLQRKRWSVGETTRPYRRAQSVTTWLVVGNLVLVNMWLYPLQTLRIDATSQGEFSLSPTTRNLLANLQEPLTLRAFISEKTHPLLAPLIPQIRDLFQEYAIASNGKVKADVVDPASDPAIEQEAAQTYGIQPTPLQVSGRFEASVINAYFDIVVKYGDQNTTLSFRDLIEVNSNQNSVDVRLRNLEYDLTSAIKKVVYGFQSIDAVFAAMKDPVKLTLITTPQTLPEPLKTAPDTIKKVAEDIAKQSGGKFAFETVDPTAPNAAITQQTLINTFHLQPIPVSLFSQDSYYLDMLLTTSNKTEAISPAQDFSEASVRTAIESALKRSSQGFLKVVGLWTPPAAQTDQFGQQGPGSLAAYQMLQQQLSQDYSVRSIDLQAGQVPPDVDVLVVLAPQDMTDKERYAIDQYLMRGGSVIVGAGNYSIAQSPTGGLGLTPLQNGLNDLLTSYGVQVTQTLVMDPQNEPFPVQVARNIGGIAVQEVQAINFPFFPDIRSNAMDRTNPIVSQLPAVTMNFASPVALDPAKNANRTTSVLLKSSPNAWLSTNTQLEPNFQLYPQTGYAIEGQPQSYPLAVAIQGVFDSYFKGKPSPLLQTNQLASAQPGAAQNAAPNATPTPAPLTSSLLESSPDTARLVVLGSSEFVDDNVLQLSSRLTQNRYLNNLQLMQNAVDWSVADLDLLSIRSRGTTSRVLKPMDQREESTWEIVNYAIALAALLGIGALWYYRRRNEKPIELTATDVEKKS